MVCSQDSCTIQWKQLWHFKSQPPRWANDVQLRSKNNIFASRKGKGGRKNSPTVHWGFKCSTNSNPSQAHLPPSTALLSRCCFRNKRWIYHCRLASAPYKPPFAWCFKGRGEVTRCPTLEDIGSLPEPALSYLYLYNQHQIGFTKRCKLACQSYLKAATNKLKVKLTICFEPCTVL